MCVLEYTSQYQYWTLLLPVSCIEPKRSASSNNELVCAQDPSSQSPAFMCATSDSELSRPAAYGQEMSCNIWRKPLIFNALVSPICQVVLLSFFFFTISLELFRALVCCECGTKQLWTAAVLLGEGSQL